MLDVVNVTHPREILNMNECKRYVNGIPLVMGEKNLCFFFEGNYYCKARHLTYVKVQCVYFVFQKYAILENLKTGNYTLKVRTTNFLIVYRLKKEKVLSWRSMISFNIKGIALSITKTH